VAAPLTAGLLGGCVYSTKMSQRDRDGDDTIERQVAPAPVVVTTPAPPATVVMTPAPPATVVTAPATVVAVPSDRIISYPEGSYRLYGDATTGYYWVWIPAGSVVAAPPAPPALPRVSQGKSSTVLAARPERVITYREGRYELYGDASTGYYWVWIPTGIMPPALPPPPPRIGQGP
jgi:hypothetical protein